MVPKRLSTLLLIGCCILSSVKVTLAWRTSTSENYVRTAQGKDAQTRKKAFRKGAGTRHRLQGTGIQIQPENYKKEKKCKHLKTKKVKKHHHQYSDRTHAPHEVYQGQDNGSNRDLTTKESVSTSARGKQMRRKTNQILSTKPISRGEPDDPFFHFHGTQESFATFKQPADDDDYEYQTFWTYPYGYDPKHYAYDECEMPSMSPSMSMQPSLSPSPKPSRTPSSSPSYEPSHTPTISNEPTISFQPSLSHVPSNSMIPSSDPTYNPEFCDAYKDDGTVKVSGYAVEGEFTYEMVSSDPRVSFDDFDDLLNETNRLLGHFLTLELVCREETGSEEDQVLVQSTLKEDAFFHYGGRRGLKLQNEGIISNQFPGSSKRSLQFIDGVEPIVGKVIGKCTAPEKDQRCDQIEGNYLAYLRETDQALTPIEAQTLVLETLEQIVESGDIQGEVSMTDIVKLAWGKGSIASMYPEAQPPQSLSIGENPVTRRITSTGISVIAAASVITVVFVYAATRKMKSSEIKTIENLIDDDASQFSARGYLSEHTDIMSTSSSQKWRHDRDAHIVGEDDSVFSDTNNIIQDLATFENGQLSKSNLGGYTDALNVHSCTSATCAICREKRRNPTFCRVDILNPVVEIEEGERGVEASIYDVMGLEPRSYQAPDTVTF